MKDLLDTINNILMFVFALGIVFLFIGEPDLWDKLHARAMGVACPASTTPTPNGAAANPASVQRETDGGAE